MPLIRSLLAQERGIALPVALAVLFAVAALAAVAAKAGVQASHQSFRDRSVKRALQAAQAGVATAIYRMNLMQPAPNECVTPDPATGTLRTTLVPATGWCAAETEDLGGGATTSVRVSQSGLLTYNSNGQVLTERSIVSSGLVDGVSRRVLVRAKAALGAPLFPKDFAVVSKDSVTFSNSVRVTGHLGSNGNITLQNVTRVVGNATPGPGPPPKRVTLQQSATVTGSRNAALLPFVFAPVKPPPIGTVDNARVCAAGVNSDPCTSMGSITWNPATRVLRMSGSATLTLTGDTYSFCRIELSQSAMIRIAARSGTVTPLRMYLDSPENCGGAAGMGSVQITQTSGIVNLNSSPSTFVILAAGSATRATTIQFGQSGGGGTQVTVGVYAPYSTVILEQSVQVLGAVVAKLVTMRNSAMVTYDPRIQEVAEDALLVYQDSGYLECTSVPTGTAPDTGC